MVYQSVNPYNGKVLKSLDVFTDAQLETALTATAAAFERWKHHSDAEPRATVMAKAAALLTAQADRFAQMATLEMGKRIQEARDEVKFSEEMLAYYAKHAAKHAEAFLANTALAPTRGSAHIENSPFCLLFCIAPWNFLFINWRGSRGHS